MGVVEGGWSQGVVKDPPAPSLGVTNVHGSDPGLRSETVWAQHARSAACWVVLGKSLNLFVPQFLFWLIRNSIAYLKGLY